MSSLLWVKKTAEIEWIAGLFEGEGTVRIMRWQRLGRPTPTSQLGVAVANCDTALLKPLQARYGGWISSTGNHGNARWKQGYRWETSSKGAEKFLTDIAPFLKAERNKKRVSLALRIQAIKRQRREEQREEARRHYEKLSPLLERLKELNKKGPA